MCRIVVEIQVQLEVPSRKFGAKKLVFGKTIIMLTTQCMLLTIFNKIFIQPSSINHRRVYTLSFDEMRKF